MSESCCHDECHSASDAAASEKRSLLVDGAWFARVVASGAAILAGLATVLWQRPHALSLDLPLGVATLPVALYLVAMAISIVAPAARAFRAARARVLDINVLMVVAAAGAAWLGDWLEAASILWLFSVAQWLEARSLARARRAIRSLMALAPAKALVRRHGADVQVDVSTIAPGEIVVVRSGECVPLDGTVVRGASAVNQAPVTGESLPVDKTPGDDVFAGSINGTGVIDIEVLRAAGQSTIAQIARLVEQAQSRRAPIQTFVDRFARRYTPAVLLLALLVAVVPPLLAGATAASFSIWIYRALTLVVVACPCALVISTPVSIVSALTAAAREGVLIKGGAHLERLASVRCVAFDKTGTLTHGRVRVTDVFGVDGATSGGVLSVAAALGSRSEHPIGRAIVSRAREHGVQVPPGDGYRALPGLGAEAMVAELPAIMGSHRLFEERQLCTPSLHDRIDEVTGLGGTAVLVGHDGSALGVIGVSDTMRSGSPEAVRQLRAAGVDRIVLLSGDSQANADAMGMSTGADESHGELMPADKADWIGTLRDQYGPVAMIGDGINDAPALAAADVGIAMGAGGTGVAIETADVALMSDDLSAVSFALRLGRLTLGNIRVNVGIALGLKIAFVALAATGVATLWMAILADTGASLLVTANGLRLLKVRSGR